MECESLRSQRQAEPEVHVGARPKQGHTGRNCQAGVRSSLRAPCPMLFPLSQETSQMTCCCSLSPYWGEEGVLGLVRPGIRGQRTEAFIRTAGVLAWGERRVHTVKIQKKTVEDQKPLEDRDGAGSYFVFCLPHRQTHTHRLIWAREKCGNEMRADKLVLSG